MWDTPAFGSIATYSCNWGVDNTTPSQVGITMCYIICIPDSALYHTLGNPWWDTYASMSATKRLNAYIYAALPVPDKFWQRMFYFQCNRTYLNSHCDGTQSFEYGRCEALNTATLPLQRSYKYARSEASSRPVRSQWSFEYSVEASLQEYYKVLGWEEG